MARVDGDGFPVGRHGCFVLPPALLRPDAGIGGDVAKRGDHGRLHGRMFGEEGREPLHARKRENGVADFPPKRA